MKFCFQLELERKELTFEVERIYHSRQIERFKVGPIGSKQFLIVQSDRPTVETRKLTRSIHWQKVEGYITNPYTLAFIFEEIERAFSEPPPPFQGTLGL